SARASARTRSAVLRPTTASPGPRRWKRRYSAGSAPGRTGFSTAPTHPDPLARWAGSAPGSAPTSTGSESSHDHRGLLREDPEQRRPARGPPVAAGARILAAELPE